MRLSNELDQNFVRAAVPDGAADLLSFLPSLGTAETMVFGESVNLPMRVILNTLAEEYRPHSSSAKFTELWKNEMATPEMMGKVFDRWRARSYNVEGKSSGSAQVPVEAVARAGFSQAPAAAPPARPSTAQPRALNQQPINPQSNNLAAQVRERLRAQATPASKMPQGLADVKSRLNSAFHKNI